MALDTWLAFFVACWLISLSPGAGAISCMAAGLRYGFRRALPNIAGLIAGILNAFLLIYVLFLLARLVLEYIPMFNREWRPRGGWLVFAEVVFTVTEAPGVERVVLVRGGAPLAVLGDPPFTVPMVASRAAAPPWVQPRPA